jgi:hypothetical protein
MKMLQSLVADRRSLARVLPVFHGNECGERVLTGNVEALTAAVLGSVDPAQQRPAVIYEVVRR